jgi:hypothetical protein
VDSMTLRQEERYKEELRKIIEELRDPKRVGDRIQIITHHNFMIYLRNNQNFLSLFSLKKIEACQPSIWGRQYEFHVNPGIVNINTRLGLYFEEGHWIKYHA